MPFLGTKMITAVDCTIARTKTDISNVFLVQYLSSPMYFEEVNTCLAGGTRQRISRSNLADFLVPVPKEKNEQEAIGNYFKSLDNLITLHQRKYLSLCIFFHRWPCLQMTNTWEQRKFCEITYPAGEKNRDNMPYESYSISNESGFIPQSEQFEHGGTMTTADKRMYYIVKPNSFAYNPARINVGSIGYHSESKNVIVSSLYEVFKTTDDIDDRFLWHWFKSSQFQKMIEQYQEGGVRLYFYYDKLCLCSTLMPTTEEQRRIGEFIDQLDDLITLHQRKPFYVKNEVNKYANRCQTNRFVLRLLFKMDYRLQNGSYSKSNYG